MQGQDSYRYSVNLIQVKNDQLSVELLTPRITSSSINFYLPKIVPGTYMNSNYGKYVHNLRAFDNKGASLPVKKKGDNGWTITNAQRIHRITYDVEDTWDSEINNEVYSMCGTNFEEGKNFVINTCGLFGFFDGMKRMPIELNFTKPQHFYAATGLKPISVSDTKDQFRCANTDELYDSPIMFSLPDTSTVMVGKSEVLVAVYSPNKLATAKFMAANMKRLLLATKDYLGGKLPVDKYAFLFYFNGEQKIKGATGAWEHSYSSFYCMSEQPQEQAINNWVDISAHEFFHIVTPLTISSKEVKEFDFNETHLSRHVWLYEGSTEYYAHHMQVWSGLKTPEEYLKTLAGEINISRSYFDDSLSFTELSTESAGKWKDQYVNVYMKGALISACLDLYLLQLSDAQYAFRNLKHDLGVKYGKDKYFLDDQLFDDIEQLTYPEIKQFLLTHVAGNKPIPYEKYFAFAGVDYIPQETVKEFTIGGVEINVAPGGALLLGTKNMNEVGKNLGYQEGDELVKLNGREVNAGNLDNTLDSLYKSLAEGEKLEVQVKRKNSTGALETITLNARAVKVDKVKKHIVRLNPHPTAQQLKVRNAWFNNH